MNDRLWTMKVVVEKGIKFICLMKTKFVCLEDFPFHKQQAAFRSVSVRNTFVAVEYEEASITRHFGIIEAFERAGTRNVGFLSLDCGNLTLINSSDAKFWCFTFQPTPHLAFFFLETDHSSF